MRRLAGILAVLALVATGCGSSPEDKAHDAGTSIGGQLYAARTASSAEQVRDALRQISTEVRSLGELPAGYRNQVADIAGQLQSSLQSASDQGARRAALADARSQLEALSSDTNSVVNEFRRGVRQGYEDAAG